MGGGRAGGFGHFGGFHGHPTPVGHVRFRFGRSFRGFGLRSFAESSATVAGDDDMDDYDTAEPDGDLADMHFRAEESFGPWDIPIRPVVAEPIWSGPWGAARMDPWHGYESEDW
jgi:hypothetical protein